MDIEQRAFELGQQGFCCSQIIIKIGLEIQGNCNDALVSAMRGLCYGLHKQRQCGALCAGACLLALFSEEHVPELAANLAEWFEDRFGSVGCAELVGVEQTNLQKCMEITAETCAFCLEILEERGLMEP